MSAELKGNKKLMKQVKETIKFHCLDKIHILSLWAAKSNYNGYNNFTSEDNTNLAAGGLETYLDRLVHT